MPELLTPNVPASVVIRVEKLQKSFDGKEQVLRDVNLEIPKGKITVLIGFSGTGKSVLLKMLLGLLPPTSGLIEVLGKDVTKFDVDEAVEFSKNFGVLFQNAALFDDMTALQNVLFPIREHRKDLKRAAARRLAQDKLLSVGLKPRDFEKLPSELSGGMRKRVGLARALAIDPEILFYDEPTTGLDPIMTEMVDNLILDTHRHREGMTSVVVTHDLYAAFRFGDFIAMLNDGVILLSGTADDFLSSEIELVKRFVSKGVHRE
ncbi:MAG: ABC transporter ATP-binding protein [Bdellovibrionales bacterium CG10_big_fil_rev_8_21_14_0_10_45_34]|nr:MAG: ABC transporter ATP-binding protein [Bdellovibrionales bacterium CG10_big_fil_rev_8_21_14_0_10_45_34]